MFGTNSQGYRTSMRMSVNGMVKQLCGEEEVGFVDVWDSIVDRRMRQCTNIHESQFGFMPGRSTTYAIFILKQTIEKHREGQKNIRVTFIDIEKSIRQHTHGRRYGYPQGNEMCRKGTLG